MIKLGVTLFSYTKEYCSGIFSFEDCVRYTAQMGLDGYEIVAAQMSPSYPYISDEFLGQVNALKAKYGISPICYAANTDMGMRYDRDLTEQELLSATLRDIRSAHKLGCKIIRVQYRLSPEVLVKAVPYAEEYDVKLGIEIHNPETPSTPKMQAYYDAIVASGSKHIGFVPDFGCFADKPNYNAYEGALERGANKELLDYAVQLCYDQVPMKEAEALLMAKNPDKEVMASFYMNYGYLQFTKNPDFEGLKRIMPYCFHFHGKFHHMLDDGTERSIPYEKILPIIQDAGFDGYIMSEYEGRRPDCSTVDMIQRQIDMQRRILK